MGRLCVELRSLCVSDRVSYGATVVRLSKGAAGGFGDLAGEVCEVDVGSTVSFRCGPEFCSSTISVELVHDHTTTVAEGSVLLATVARPRVPPLDAAVRRAVPTRIALVTAGTVVGCADVLVTHTSVDGDDAWSTSNELAARARGGVRILVRRAVVHGAAQAPSLCVTARVISAEPLEPTVDRRGAVATRVLESCATPVWNEVLTIAVDPSAAALLELRLIDVDASIGVSTVPPARVVETAVVPLAALSRRATSVVLRWGVDSVSDTQLLVTMSCWNVAASPAFGEKTLEVRLCVICGDMRVFAAETSG